ncbi:MAG: glycosyltransferase family 2 protein [Halobacteriaceae archaeon]
MDVGLVVPTLNSRDQLAGCLDALAAHAIGAEVVVVNGPSTDGTSGFARSHAAVDRLVELPERNLNAARNAGIAATEAEGLCFLGQDSEIESGWMSAVREHLQGGAAAVTGPIHRRVSGGLTTEAVEEEHICGRLVRYFDGGNVGFRRSILEDLDGFDEYLDTGAARDLAHRLAGIGHDVIWDPDVAVTRTEGDDVDDRTARREADALGLKYRAIAYRAVKNYGLRPAIGLSLTKHVVTDGLHALRDVAGGEVKPTTWVGDGSRVMRNLFRGILDGRRARRADPSPRRNPNGLSARTDRAVAHYDA